jgi:hypothetical protein
MDGSRKDTQIGIGIYGPSVRFFEDLASKPAVFLAEMYSINVCARICLEHEGNDNKHIFLFKLN